MKKIVFDIGGTNTRLGYWDGEKINQVDKFPTLKSTDFIATLRQYASGKDFVAISGGIAGQLDKQGRIIFAPNLDDSWQQFPLVESLSLESESKTVVLNDVAAGGQGEALFGAGMGLDRFGYIAIGTGFGGCLIESAAPGRNDFGFEIGHSFWNKDITLEEKFSGSAIESQNGIPPAFIKDDSFWNSLSTDLAQAIFNIAIIWSVKHIVIGGSMALKSPGYNLDLVQQEIDTYTKKLGFVDQISIVPAKLKDLANLYGATV